MRLIEELLLLSLMNHSFFKYATFRNTFLGSLVLYRTLKLPILKLKESYTFDVKDVVDFVIDK